MPVRARTGRIVDGAFTAGPFVERLGDGDDDGDGAPGVSVVVRHPRVGEGAVHVRQQATVSYEGRADGDGIRGAVTSSVEQELLGATRWWLRMRVPRRSAGPGEFVITPGTCPMEKSG
jgi:hypothetical protein